MLFASFTVFTALSVFGVFLGTAAPIIALSVMSGFENDLKTKIRATKADVVVETRDDRPFVDWKGVERSWPASHDIAGSMAYVEAEVIVKHATNAAGMGIVLRGIEPGRAPNVLGIEREDEGRAARLPGAPGPDPERPDRDAGRRSDEKPEKDKAAGPRVLPGILLGEELFQHILRVFVGSEVDVACPMCGVGPTGPCPS